jgi:hypothetical protein
MSRTPPLRLSALFTTLLALVGAIAPAPVLADEPAAEPTAEPPAPRPRRSSEGEDAPNAFVLEGAMRIDVQRLDRYDRVNRLVEDESDSARALGGSLYLGLMFGMRDNLRIGGGFGWGGSLEVDPEGGDAIGMGQLLFLDIRLDVLLPVKRDLFIILTPSVGASIIAPGDELREVINMSRNGGFNTWRGPRLGLMVGADAGVRWEAASWFALRGTLGYLWSWSPLLRSSAESNFASAEREWTLTAHRLRIAIGAEVTF